MKTRLQLIDMISQAWARWQIERADDKQAAALADEILADRNAAVAVEREECARRVTEVVWGWDEEDVQAILDAIRHPKPTPTGRECEHDFEKFTGGNRVLGWGCCKKCNKYIDNPPQPPPATEEGKQCLKCHTGHELGFCPRPEGLP